MSGETMPSGRIRSVCISTEKGTVKQPVDAVHVNLHGIAGDAHAGEWHRQVSLLAGEAVDAFAGELGRPLEDGEFAENITTDGIDLDLVAPLDRLRIGEVELEVTQIGKKCHGSTCAIFQAVGKCVMPTRGLFSRVIRGGDVKPGDPVTWIPRKLRVRIVTLSDRASRGEYKDLSGPRIREMVEAHLEGTRWHVEISSVVLPDDVQLLRHELVRCREQGVDFVFTTGGTGVGPRDITVDEVLDLADRTVPGIMEHIRVKYGAVHPNALLSRSVVGILRNTVVYTLPGSVKAVNEYMTEILTTFEHLFLMLHGLGH